MMRRFTVAYLILFSFMAIFSCKGDSDVLATYKGGDITRGEFYKWMEAKHVLKDSVLKSKKKQENKLNKMILEIIAGQKAREEGFDKTDQFKDRERLTIEGQLIKRLYEKEISAKVSFKETAIKIKQILIGVKPKRIDKDKKGIKKPPSKEDMDKEFENAMTKAKEVIEKLDKGEKFEDLAKKYSDHHSKMKGGDIGWAVPALLPPEFSDVAFTLEEGEYNKEPIKTAKGVFIIKIEDKKEVNEDNINDVIENKSQAKMIINRLQGKNSKDYLDKLTNAEDVQKFFDKVTSKNKSDVIFKIGDKSYTVKELDSRINMRMSSFRGNKKPPTINDEQKKGLAKNYFRYELLKRDAFKKGIDKEEDYKSQIQMTMNDILSREYMKKKFESEDIVPIQKVKDEYNKNKEKKYFKMVKKNKKRVKEILPFSKVKDRIERILKRRMGSELREKWKKEILKEYEFELDTSELEGE